MARKPTNLIYGVDDKPPLATTLLLGFQHIFITIYCFHLSGGNSKGDRRIT